MADPDKPETSSLATGYRKDGALEAALDRLAQGWTPDRPDTPDLRVTAVRRLPAAGARYAPFPPALDSRLVNGFRARGISELYTHQVAAIEHALAGRHVVVITPTASGKTLCYNAPGLHTILQDPSSRALYLFPTKGMCCNFPKAARERLVELAGLRLMPPPRTSC